MKIKYYTVYNNMVSTVEKHILVICFSSGVYHFFKSFAMCYKIHAVIHVTLYQNHEEVWLCAKWNKMWLACMLFRPSAAFPAASNSTTAAKSTAATSSQPANTTGNKCIRLNNPVAVAPFLVHLSRRLKCTIVITRCPSSVVRPSVVRPSVVNFSHFWLLLWNRWTEFN